MKLVAIILLSLSILVHADHVVFVHGLGGFGPTELLGLNYWGYTGIFPSQDYLGLVRGKGHSVYYASVGPLSSNHDRACELYAQIKGTKVDYGAVHSARYGHQRYGKDYTGKGFVPSWDGVRRIHLVGHSMGGNTIRYLEHLIQKGLPEEVAGTPSTTLSNLFKTTKSGGNTWIHSITTISTPHDGSTLHTVLGGTLVNFVKNFLGIVSSVAGLASTNAEWGYNFDLDHFGLTRNSGESFSSYYNRVMSSSLWDPGFKDFASYDLGPDGSREFNAISKLAYPSTYYFSFATFQTHACFGGNQCPDIDIEALMGLTSSTIGKLNGICSAKTCFDDSWEPNDGVVPLRSSMSPQIGITGYVAPRSWTSNVGLVPGVWYNRKVNRDHLQIVGFRLNPLTFNAANGIYTLIGDTINAIKSSSTQFLEAPEDIPTAEVDVGAIVGGIVGSGLAFVLLGILVKKRRESRHQIRMVTSFNSNKSPTLKKKEGPTPTTLDGMIPCDPLQVEGFTPEQTITEESNKSRLSIPSPRIFSGRKQSESILTSPPQFSRKQLEVGSIGSGEQNQFAVNPNFAKDIEESV